MKVILFKCCSEVIWLNFVLLLAEMCWWIWCTILWSDTVHLIQHWPVPPPKDFNWNFPVLLETKFCFKKVCWYFPSPVTTWWLLCGHVYVYVTWTSVSSLLRIPLNVTIFPLLTNLLNIYRMSDYPDNILPITETGSSFISSHSGLGFSP